MILNILFHPKETGGKEETEETTVVATGHRPPITLNIAKDP